MYKEGNILVGVFWGAVLSIMLWFSFFGWIKLLYLFLFFI